MASHRESRSDLAEDLAISSLALKVAEESSAVMSANEALPVKLSQLAEYLADLKGIDGALVVAFDEEDSPVDSGSWRLDLLAEAKDKLEILVEIRNRIPFNRMKPTWFEIGRTLFKLSGPSQELLTLPVQDNGLIRGLIIVLVTGQKPWEDQSQALNALRLSANLIATAIRNAVRMEAWSRIERLQELAKEEFRSKGRDLARLVCQLAGLYEAGAVTLFLEDQNELRLAASTDPTLGTIAPVIYLRGQGLTGYIFKSGKPLRLKNTVDADEVFKATGLLREGPVHPESEDMSQSSVQFLGVPLRYGDIVVGVLRMSRGGSATRFTVNDEKSLQFFGDLLATDIARSQYFLLMRGVLESASESITVSKREPDGEGGTWPKVIMANPGTENLLGLSQEEILGCDAREFYPSGAYTKLQRGLDGALARLTSQNLEFTEYGPVETQVKRADGSSKTVEISYRIFANRMVHPPTLYTIGIARDTSDRRRFLDLSNAMDIVYFRADRQGRTVESTPNESKMTGYSQEELAAGFPREKLYADPLERERLLDKLRRQSDGQLKSQVVTLRRKDGSVFQVDADVRILRDSAGTEMGIEGFYKDVSERIQLQGFVDLDTRRVLGEEELFAKLKQHAEFHMNYTISLGHQLQTPLSSLVENLRNFDQGLTGQGSSYAIERLPYIIGQAVVCTRLVRNLSYMDKILRGEPFLKEKLVLRKLVIETKIDFRHLLKEKNLELIIDDESIRRYVQIEGNWELFRQVFVNLVDNAIKYSLPGTTIQIRAQQWPSGPILEVSNQGLLVPEEVRERVFERGFRTDRAQALIPHGTGLGLWLVRKILEAHDATIRCLEVVEQGQRRIVFRIAFSRSASKSRSSA